MVTELSGTIGFVAPNAEIIKFINQRTGVENETTDADDDAQYEQTFNFDVDDLEPLIACPDSPDNVKSVSEVAGTEVDQVFIGSCTNGRFEDLEVAARILKGRKVDSKIRLIIVPATMEVAQEALAEGFYQIFLEAGAVVANPSCALCTIGHPGVLAPGDVMVSTSNRNFPDKIGKGGQIYLASPATAASTAIKGEISDPREMLK